MFFVLISISLVPSILTLIWEPEPLSKNYGFVSKPIMGWSTWLALNCRPCDPTVSITRCLGEEAIVSAANNLIERGYRKLGYEYIIIDDCWQNKEREWDNTLTPNPVRFKNGMRRLANNLHTKDLKLGLFSDLGPKSGAGLPGSGNHFREDALSFVNWGVDYVKMSGYTADPAHMNTDYPKFYDYLQNYTKKPIVFACSWPVYQLEDGYKVNYNQVANTCQTWRFSYDVGGWDSILKIMDSYERQQDDILQMTGFGSWCDADLLAVNVQGVTLDQLKAQMAVWCIMPSSLIFSADVRDLTPAQEAILKNPAIIAINQDEEARRGYKLKLPFSDSTAQLNQNVDIWMRPVRPIASNGKYSYAIAFVYRLDRNISFVPINYSVTLSQLGLDNPDGYKITDLYSEIGTVFYSGTLLLPMMPLNMLLQPSGVAFFKADVVENTRSLTSSRWIQPFYDPSIRY